MNKLDFPSLIDCFLWISETIGGMVFYQVFLLSKSQVQAVEISSPRKPKAGSKIR
jgi:hypothetical protein